MGQKWEESLRAEVESEHGPVVVIGHPDGSVFAFKRMGREQYEVRSKRMARNDADADEKLLQERAVWPSREAWNAYVATAAFEVDAYAAAYQKLHGRKDVSPDADGALSNGEVSFVFRKPTRPEIKLFRSRTMAGDRDAALMGILTACSTPEFAAWIDGNMFAVGKFADAFLEAFGMQVSMGDDPVSK